MDGQLTLDFKVAGPPHFHLSWGMDGEEFECSLSVHPTRDEARDWLLDAVNELHYRDGIDPVNLDPDEADYRGQQDDPEFSFYCEGQDAG